MKTCQEITEMVEKANFSKLSIADKLAISLHGKICKECRKYFKDSKSLDKLLSKRFKHKGNYAFSKEEKKELIEKLENVD
jgi:hypothetical protein